MSVNNILDQILKVSKSMERAQDQTGKSVIYRRKSVMDDAVITLRNNPEANINLYGIKDTEQIQQSINDKLSNTEGLIFHTVDTMAHGGRAIDVNLVNPLTGKVMTGSSSGSCVNILLGINDLAIGTDGGGSVLAPAISCGLFSVMGKGLGLRGSSKRLSTDNIEFIPGLGIIAKNFKLCKEVVLTLVDKENAVLKDKYKVAVPQKGTNRLPSGIEMRQLLDPIFKNASVEIEIVDIPGEIPQDRNSSIELLRNLFKEADLVITAEGPVDTSSLGDSVIGQWGLTGSKIQSKSAKYLMKVANMIDGTAISIPTQELATSVVIISPEGVQCGLEAIAFAEMIADLYQRPTLFEKYFFESYKNSSKGFLESL